MENTVQETHVRVNPGTPTGQYTKCGDAIYYSERETKTGLKRTYFTVKPGPRKSYVSKKIIEKLNQSSVKDDISRTAIDTGDARG